MNVTVVLSHGCSSCQSIGTRRGKIVERRFSPFAAPEKIPRAQARPRATRSKGIDSVKTRARILEPSTKFRALGGLRAGRERAGGKFTILERPRGGYRRG